MNQTLLMTGLLLGTIVVTAVVTYLVVRRRYVGDLQWLKRDRKEKDLLASAARLEAMPQFHADVLEHIEGLLKNGAKDEGLRYLQLYKEYTQQMLASIGVPARAVKEEATFVERYLKLEQLLMGDRLTFGVIVAADVPAETMLPTMLLHTNCQNAIKHGLALKPEGGRIEVIITRHEDDVVVTVEDNGVGRRAAAKSYEHDTRQELRIMNEQIQFYNKLNSRRIKLRVNSLRDDDKKIIGTRVETVIPVGYRFG